MKISFWFFVAMIFLLYGLIILGSGIYYWMTAATGPNVAYHVSVWWGLVLLVMSGIFFIFNKVTTQE